LVNTATNIYGIYQPFVIRLPVIVGSSNVINSVMSSYLWSVTSIRELCANVDPSNGEQALSGWAILNFKLKHAVNKKFALTLGMNNIFDTTYAQSNTYADLTLLSTGGGDILLLNETGRYFYTNLDFKF